MYTDGVNEAQNVDEQFFGYERLLGVTSSKLDQDAAELHNAIIDSVQTFVGKAPQFDDITLMVLKRYGF
jgi:sigma-B regulation protein RsbU (phosphoserine phosphatase)